MHRTYTFAAPRVGDARFAALYSQSFKLPTDFWALQVENDAVPHLPFAAWGFQHPEGVVRLTDAPVATADASPSGIQRSRDHGDSVHYLRPREGDVVQWAACHDIEEYLKRLRAATAGSGFAVPAVTTDMPAVGGFAAA